MKSHKFLIFIIVICVITIVYLLYRLNDCNPVNPITEGTEDTNQANRTTQDCNMHQTEFGFSGDPSPTHGLAPEMVSQMLYTYASNVSNSAHPGWDDAHSVWFDLGVIKKFIWSIEKEQCNCDSFDTDKLGIRFYYGAYPAVMGSNEGRHTLMMLPTYKKAGANVDFDPRYYDCGTNTPTSIQSVYNTLKVTAGSQMFVLAPDNVFAQNMGELRPPFPTGINESNPDYLFSVAPGMH